MKFNLSKPASRIVLALVAALVIVTTAVAQTPSQTRDNDITRRELSNFDRFLDSHHEINRDLKARPALINDADYVAKHPELQKFLQQHPGVREELKENPGQFMRREGRFERNGGDITRTELRNFDKYLDSHPEVASELKKDPTLINNPDFMARHPGLQEFLRTHPNAARDLKEHPRVFERRERQFDRREERREKKAGRP